MSLFLRVDHALTQAPYEQIRAQIHALIAADVLAEGDRLPPVRQLASDLDVAAATVARAYQELEADGVLQGQGRRGSVITARRAVLSSAERARRLDDAARTFAASARALGVSIDEASEALLAIWNGAHAGSRQ